MTWARPANSGPAITGYVITPAIGGAPQAPIFFASTATSATVVGLSNGIAYTFTVAAMNSIGTGTASSPSSPIVVGTPTAPAFLTVKADDASAELSWWPQSPTSAPITGYVITPYLGGIAQSPQTFAGSARAQRVIGLTNGATYTFAVGAVNAFGAGPATMSVPARIGVPPAPPVPTAEPGSGQATVTWSAPESYGMAITGYTIVLTVGGVAQPPRSLPPATTSWTFTGLANGTTYQATVRATSDIGTSDPGTVSFVPGSPGTPRNAVAVPGNFSAVVSWTAPPDNGSPITAYEVAPYIGSFNSPAARIYPADQTSQEVSNLNCNGCEYTFRITAMNAFGRGGTAVTEMIHVGSPPAPTSVSAQPGNGSATVSWTAPPVYHILAITAYIVTPYVGAMALPAQTFTSTATTQVVTGLTNGVAYTFRVAAFNAWDGPQSAPTAPVTVGAPSAPAAPTVVGGAGQAAVTWTAPAPNSAPISGYVVTPFVNGLAGSPRAFDASTTTRVITGLSSGTTYRFSVAAVNALGTSPPSALSGPVTPT